MTVISNKTLGPMRWPRLSTLFGREKGSLGSRRARKTCEWDVPTGSGQNEPVETTEKVCCILIIYLNSRISTQ
ncbi:uncharacterized protein MYCFIDRAFT_179357 [Pseudocercospora fijiensis CIRAD86]|uniref:Uncharacterized protein n=1 Tax=Pseudocercospora fijiensis (strain CIRAD86) TaxID=383855 RepID=M2YJH3_PSEFD|nr:uncharacterized protein MYCFIDRAFT_179357 [Pseudocercospora fijiensis CIRAD86]EME77890.1 hypothetical protein MYCFIDRAFT_179357 [Pseudocercospora fijiensis CIRAD86]